MRVPMHVRKAAKAKLKQVEPKQFDYADVLMDAWRMAGHAVRDHEDATRWWVTITPRMHARLAVREYSFDSTTRRLDIAFPEMKVAIECQGGENVAHMGHRSKEGTGRDVRKANDAGRLGWYVIYFTGEQVRKSPLECLEKVRQLVDGKLPQFE